MEGMLLLALFTMKGSHPNVCITGGCIPHVVPMGVILQPGVGYKAIARAY